MATNYNPINLTIEECSELGVTFPSVRMENGEYRFRCTDKNGYGYALTKMSDDGSGWQNSHYHKSTIETYVVQRGWIGFATIAHDGQLAVRVCKEGEVLTTKINQPHNVYMPAGAIIHTVKHGDTSMTSDWFAHPELDVASKRLSQKDILQLSSFSVNTV